MKKLMKSLVTLITYVMAFIYFFPILWLFITSLKQEKDAAIIPPSFIFSPTFEHFHEIWNNGVAYYMLNSAIVAIASTFIALLLGVPAAYALALYRIKRSNDILFWFISTKFMPVAGVIIPLYLLFKSLNLLDTLSVLILVYAAMNMPLVLWMMRSFFKDIPYELIEASQVDGATGLNTFFKITLPLVKSGLISTILLSMVFAWNEFFFALSLTYTSAKTMPVYMTAFMTQEGLFWAKMSAASVFAIVPVLILGWFSQKQLVRGLTMGAVKG
ncbi:sugar ABC transporter permease [Pullulanibacillus camelliae]|uniref:Sugar ABC transporter permease n=1 Tax=Pullulanibacillus camelliae TaxID=1707096 RepID=A0A8J2VK66_9BACL|nr:carbohydrate ABC transporter permease [Pullulanibacillus camelliae]GGE29600.1 sugar ABC transporter permease [Pullulanibacillus camelliae]